MEDLVLSCLESRVEGNRNLYARFLVGPFLKGDALTVATALRRALLSSVESVGITALYIQGITHEFSTIAGVRESVLELSLNFQAIVLCYDKTFFQKKNCFNDIQIGYLQVQGPKIVYANDLKLPLGIKLVDPTQYIATISKEGSIILKFVIGKKNNFLRALNLSKEQSIDDLRSLLPHARTRTNLGAFKGQPFGPRLYPKGGKRSCCCFPLRGSNTVDVTTGQSKLRFAKQNFFAPLHPVRSKMCGVRHSHTDVCQRKFVKVLQRSDYFAPMGYVRSSLPIRGTALHVRRRSGPYKSSLRIPLPPFGCGKEILLLCPSGAIKTLCLKAPTLRSSLAHLLTPSHLCKGVSKARARCPNTLKSLRSKMGKPRVVKGHAQKQNLFFCYAKKSKRGIRAITPFKLLKQNEENQYKTKKVAVSLYGQRDKEIFGKKIETITTLNRSTFVRRKRIEKGFPLKKKKPTKKFFLKNLEKQLNSKSRLKQKESVKEALSFYTKKSSLLLSNKKLTDTSLQKQSISFPVLGEQDLIPLDPRMEKPIELSKKNILKAKKGSSYNNSSTINGFWTKAWLPNFGRKGKALFLFPSLYQNFISSVFSTAYASRGTGPCKGNQNKGTRKTWFSRAKNERLDKETTKFRSKVFLKNNLKKEASLPIAGAPVKQPQLNLFNATKAVTFFNKHKVFKSNICLRNIIPLDLTLTPVLKVNFVTEIDDEVLYLRQKIRERIVIEIWTNGSIHPRQALHDAALSLTDMFASFRSVYQVKSSFLPISNSKS